MFCRQNIVLVKLGKELGMGKKIKTLCKHKDLLSKKNRESLLEIVGKPTHVCSKCLRVASDKGYLCKSEKMYDTVQIFDMDYKKAE